MPTYPYSLTVTNPGAETGNTTGWTNDTSTLVVRTTDTGVSPRTGTYYFCGSASGATSKCHQDISLPAEVLTQVDSGCFKSIFSIYQNGISSDTDSGWLGLIALDGSNNVLGSQTTSEAHVTTAWTLKTISLNLPALTRTIRVELYGKRYSGTQLSTYWDDASLVIDYAWIPDEMVSLSVMDQACWEGSTGTYRPFLIF